MPSSILYHLDRKTSMRLTWFIIVVLVMAVIFRIVFPTKKNTVPDRENVINKQIDDSIGK